MQSPRQRFIDAYDAIPYPYKDAVIPSLQLVTCFENHYGVSPMTPNDVTVNLSPRRLVARSSNLDDLRERLVTRLDEGDLRVDFVDALIQALESGRITERALWRAVEQAEQDWRDGNVRRKWVSLKSWFNGVQNGSFEASPKRLDKKFETQKKQQRQALAFAKGNL